MFQTELTDGERYMQDWHDRYPGETSKSLGVGRIRGTAMNSYELLANAVPDQKVAQRILDIGCGDGQLLAQLMRCRNVDVSGNDISEQELSLARKMLGQKADLRCARVQALPYNAKTFDVVLSHMVLMLIDDVGSALSEVRRVLKPGGLFASIIGGPIALGDAFELFIALFKDVSKSARQHEIRMGNPITRSEEGLRELFGRYFISPIQVTDFRLDFGGHLDHVWAALSKTYCLSFLSPDGAVALEDRFRREAISLARESGEIPCSMNLRLVATTDTST